MEKPTKRWWLWGLLFIASLGILLSFFLIAQPKDRVTIENFFKLRDGMNEQEVALLLGKPTETVSRAVFSNGMQTIRRPGPRERCWGFAQEPELVDQGTAAGPGAHSMGNRKSTMSHFLCPIFFVDLHAAETAKITHSKA